MLTGSNLVLGGNVFYDRWDTGIAAFNQVGAGVELLGNGWGITSNAYVPVGNRRRQIGPSIGSIVDHDIFATRRYQAALGGFDLDYSHTLYTGENTALRGVVGTYFQYGIDTDDGFGVKARAELDVSSATNLNLTVQNDTIFDTTVLFGVEFTLPGRDRYSNRYSQTVYNRLTERIARKPNISVADYHRTTDTGFDAFFLQQGGTGTGLQASPYTLADLAMDPRFGPGDIAFLMNPGGTITGNILIDDPGQQIIGSPDASGFATTVLPEGTILTQGGLGGRATIDGQIMFAAPGRASGFDIGSATQIPMFVDGLGMGDIVSIDSVNILGSVDDGIQIQNSDGAQVQFLAGTNGGLIQDVAGDGIQALGDVDLLLDDVVFNNVGMNAIRTNYTGTFIAMGHTIINNPGYNGIFLTNNVNSTFIFEDLTINGGGNGLYLGGFTGDFTVTGDAVFNQQVSTAILQPAAAAGNVSNLSFGSLTIDQVGGYAVALESHQGTFNVDGAAVIERTDTIPVALGLLSTDSSTEFSFGSLEVNNSGTALALINHTGDFTVDGNATITDHRILGIQSEGSTTNFSFGSLDILDPMKRSGTAVALINHNGDFDVSGAATIDGFRTLGIQVTGGATDLSFGDLEVSNGDGIGVALENNAGDFTVANHAQFNGNRGGAFLSRAGSTGDYSFGSLEAQHVVYQGYGVVLDGHTGNFTVDGLANFVTTGQWGIQARNTNTDIHLGALNVVGTNIYGVALDNHTGDFIVDGNASFTDPWQYGMLSHQSTGDISFGSLTTSNTAQYAVALDDHTGSFSVVGAANLMNVGGYGFTSTPGSTGDIHFGSLDVTGANYVGLNVESGMGNVTVDGAATIDGGNFGVQIKNRTGDVSFGSLMTANNRYVGGVFDNVNGNINVTGDFVATNVGQGWFVDKAVQVSGTTGSVNFGSLAVDGNGVLGLDFRNNQGGLTIPGTMAQGGYQSSGFINGISALDNTGDMTFGDVNVTGTGGYGTGMFVTRNNGNVTINGDAVFNNTGLHAIQMTNITGNVGLQDLTVTTNSQNGLYLDNISGNVNIGGDVNMTNPGTFGMFLDSIGGNVTATNVDIDGATSTGINISNVAGDFTVSGDTLIENTHQGIAVINTDTDLTFNNLTIQNTTGNGLSLSNSQGDVTVQGDAVFNNTGASAILSTAGSSGNLLFSNLDIDTNSATGVSLDGHNGNFTVTGLADFDGAGGTSFLAQNGTVGNYSFGSLETTGNWVNNISLTGHMGDFTVTNHAALEGGGTNGFLSQSNSMGNYSFGSLDVSGIWGNSVSLVDHSGNFTVTGQTTITGGQIGLQVHNGTGNISLQNITVDTPATNGISLFGGDKNLTITGIANINTPGANGLIINQTTGTIEIAELNVTNPGANGITMALFDGSLTVNGGTISGIQSGQQAVFKHDSGAGSVTLNDMIFSTNANDVFGLVTLEYGDGGSATLNNNQAIFANGSTGTIGYRFGSFNAMNPANLSGTGNTTTNAVEATFFDKLFFNGTVEVDSNPAP